MVCSAHALHVMGALTRSACHRHLERLTTLEVAVRGWHGSKYGMHAMLKLCCHGPGTVCTRGSRLFSLSIAACRGHKLGLRCVACAAHNIVGTPFSRSDRHDPHIL